MIKKDTKRTAFAKYQENDSATRYKYIAMNLLHLNFPSLTEDELASAIDWSISKRIKNTDCYIDNNYKHQRVDTTIIDLVNYIAERVTGCSHRSEKGCAVRAALAEGSLSQTRYDSYCAMYEEVKDVKDWQRPKV